MSLSFLLLILFCTHAYEYSLHSAVYDDGRVCCGPDVLIDGDTSTYWNSFPGQPPSPAWAIFEFEQNVKLDAFDVWNMGDTTHDMKDFELQFSTDPSGPWTVLNQWSAVTGTGWQYFDIDITLQTSYYKYWRVWILNAHSNWQPQPREFVFTYLNQQIIQDIYVRTATHGDSGSPHTVALTLWFDHTIYQCNIIPSSTNSLYGCDSLTYTIMDTCTSGASQYKIMLDVPDYNAPIFSEIYVTDFDGTVYGINSWCIPDSIVSGSRYQSQPSWLSSPNNCTTQYGSNTAEYTHLCIDTQANDCGPHQQIIYFDITKPNLYRNASPWEDATALIIPQFSCPQSSPIDCLTSAAPSNVIGWYNMESLDLTNNIWNDISINENHGTIDSSMEIGIFNGVDTADDLYLAGQSVLFGTTNTQITLGSSIQMPTSHTVFSLCKHPNPIGTKNRIITAQNYNGLFGFSYEGAGIAYEGAYITDRTDKFGSSWLISAQTKSLYRGNFNDFTVGASSPPGSTYLTINNGYYSNTGSDFAVAEVFVVDQELLLSEIQCVEQYFGDKYEIVPTTNPTTDPTLSPSKSPTKNPTQFPTRHPTANPSAAPTAAPSKHPSANPSAAPTAAPSIAPTMPPSLAPSIAPTAPPSFAPSLAPTTPPTAAPSFAPSLNPSLAPSLAPTTPPTAAPSLAPSLAPSIAPSVAPSLAPSLNPSLAPSIAPSVAPSLAPSLAPTTPPSVAPSFSPTSPPSAAPSDSPTYCYDSKFRSQMFVNDWLFSDRPRNILVSNNCVCKLILHENGNLVIHKRVQIKGITIRWDTEWETDTVRYNYSGESYAKFGINSEGFLVINEYAFRNVPSFDAIQLWKNDVNITNDDIITNDIALMLLDECCLEVIHVSNEQYMDTLWTNCIETTTEEPITTETSEQTLENGQSSLEDSESGDTEKGVVWVWIIVSILLVIALLLFFVYKRNNKSTDQIWISSQFDATNVRLETDMNEYETDQIDKWVRETKMSEMTEMDGGPVEPQFIQPNNRKY